MYVHVCVVAQSVRIHETFTGKKMPCAYHVYHTLSVSIFQSEMMMFSTLQPPCMGPHCCQDLIPFEVF